MASSTVDCKHMMHNINAITVIKRYALDFWRTATPCLMLHCCAPFTFGQAFVKEYRKLINAVVFVREETKRTALLQVKGAGVTAWVQGTPPSDKLTH
jgi:hypothetical protein